MAEAALVSIVIPHVRGREILFRCLNSLRAAAGTAAGEAISCEVVVVDNASDDGSIDEARRAFPEIAVLREEVNIGFAGACNAGIRQTRGRFIVLLNDDAEVTSGWLSPLLHCFRADDQVAACQPKLLSIQRPTFFDYAGACGGLLDIFGYPFTRGRIFQHIEKDEGQYDGARQTFWATGACVMLRRSALQTTGLFDEDFFAHMEEIDLCWRLKNGGMKIMYCGASTVYHVGGGTLSKLSPQKTFLNFRNNLVLLAKNHAPGYFRIKLFLRLCLDGIAGVKFLFSGDGKHCWAVLRAHFAFYGSLGKTMAKRRAMKKQIKKFSTTAVYEGNIVFDYFLKGRKHFSDLPKEKFL